MKVLLLTHYFAPENSAPQRRWSAFISRFVSAGHTVDVICPPPHYPHGRLSASDRQFHAPHTVSNDESGARVFRVSYVPHNGRIHTRTVDHSWVAGASVRKADQLIRNGMIRPDIVVATAPALPTLIAGRVVAARHNLPYVAEMRDAWPDLVSHMSVPTSRAAAVRAMKQGIHRYVTSLQRDADHVVTTTASFAKVLAERGVPNVSVIRNGADLERYSGLPPRRADHTELRALYMGTVGRSQGLENVVLAATRLRRLGVPISVRIVGAGAALASLRELARASGGTVEVVGAVEGSRVREYYEWADTCIVSLRGWAPFEWTVPSKLYELLATGRHITGIVAGESAEIIERTGAGHVVAPGDVQSLVGFWSDLQKNRVRLETYGAGRAWVEAEAGYDALSSTYLRTLDDARERYFVQ